jgi:hypothetical protein
MNGLQNVFMKAKSVVLLKSIYSEIDTNVLLIEIVEKENQFYVVRTMGMPEKIFESLEEAENQAQFNLKLFYKAH